MPSPGEDYQSWSTTAANNGDADTLINWVEGQARASVNNSSRSEMAAHAKNRNLLNGSIVTTGAPNAQEFLSGVSYTAVPAGLVVKLKVGAGLSNTASITLNMDGVGAILVKTATGEDLLGGEFIAGSYIDLLYNGTNWVFLYSREFIDFQLHGGGGIIIGHQQFSTPGTFTYTPTPGMDCCIIECVGGGAGGGGVSSYGTLGSLVGGGGGSGGYSRKYATAADIGAAQTIIVGSGGGGGPGGGNVGGDGTDTSVGVLCIAKGGIAGGASAANTTAGPGAPSGTGDVVAAGAPGEAGISTGTQSLSVTDPCGGGGSSFFGGGAVAVAIGTAQATPGNPGRNYGSGGGGGVSHFFAAGAAGGVGSGGAVIITEFAGRGSPGRDGATGPIGPPGPAGAGTGDVLRSGVPANGQIAQWIDAAHIQGVNLNSLALITQLAVQKFTVSGTYTPTASMKYCIIECVGGGGGGGGISADAGNSLVAGGGGAGGYSRKLATAAAIGASQTVTIGAGGVGGAAGGTVSGNTGGATSVGSLCIANGGSGGGLGGGNTGAGDGGTAGTGDLTATGAPGQAGINFAGTCPCGGGGSSLFGAGAAGVVIGGAGPVNGRLATGNGGGGGGGLAHFTTSGAAGGAGANGLVIITEYI